MTEGTCGYAPAGGRRTPAAVLTCRAPTRAPLPPAPAACTSPSAGAGRAIKERRSSFSSQHGEVCTTLYRGQGRAGVRVLQQSGSSEHLLLQLSGVAVPLALREADVTQRHGAHLRDVVAQHLRMSLRAWENVEIVVIPRVDELPAQSATCTIGSKVSARRWRLMHCGSPERGGAGRKSQAQTPVGCHAEK